MLESDYTHAESPKRAPELPLRVFNKSQLIAALRQRSRPIVIEDPDIALPFIRMLRARLPAVGIRRYHSAEIDVHWHIGQYVLPGNVHRVILKPRARPLPTLGSGVLPHSIPRYHQ
jgi:hypothetical protein